MTLILIDWENLYYTLAKDRAETVIPLKILTAVLRDVARTYPHPLRTFLYSSEHLATEELRRAAYNCSVTLCVIPQMNRVRAEKNLADTHLCAEGTALFFELKPTTVIVVAGDKGYVPLLKIVQDRGARAIVCGFKTSMADILRTSDFLRERVHFLDDMLAKKNTAALRPVAPVQRVANTPNADAREGKLALDHLRIAVAFLEKAAGLGFDPVVHTEKLLSALAGGRDAPAAEAWRSELERAEVAGIISSKSEWARSQGGWELCWGNRVLLEHLLQLVLMIHGLAKALRRRSGVRLEEVLRQRSQAAKALGLGAADVRLMVDVAVERGLISQRTSRSRAGGTRPTWIALGSNYRAMPVALLRTIDWECMPRELRMSVARLSAEMKKCGTEVTATELYARLPVGFPGDALVIAVANGFVSTREAAGQDGHQVTWVALPVTAASRGPGARNLRLYEVAKDIGVSSEVVIDVLRDMGVDVRNHMASVSIENVAAVVQRIKRVGPEVPGRKRPR